MRFAWADFNRFGLAREVIIAEIVHDLRFADTETEEVAEMSADFSGYFRVRHGTML